MIGEHILGIVRKIRIVARENMRCHVYNAGTHAEKAEVLRHLKSYRAAADDARALDIARGNSGLYPVRIVRVTQSEYVFKVDTGYRGLYRARTGRDDEHIVVIGFVRAGVVVLCIHGLTGAVKLHGLNACNDLYVGKIFKTGRGVFKECLLLLDDLTDIVRQPAGSI